MPYRSFRVRLPSGICYWTVLDPEPRVVEVPDRRLRHLRFGRDAAGSTTEMYSRATALSLQWCHDTGRVWPTAAGNLGVFMIWLRHAPSRDDPNPVVAGPGVKVVRGPRRVNAVLAAVRDLVVRVRPVVGVDRPGDQVALLARRRPR